MIRFVQYNLDSETTADVGRVISEIDAPLWAKCQRRAQADYNHYLTALRCVEAEGRTLPAEVDKLAAAVRATSSVYCSSRAHGRTNTKKVVLKLLVWLFDLEPGRCCATGHRRKCSKQSMVVLQNFSEKLTSVVCACASLTLNKLQAAQ